MSRSKFILSTVDFLLIMAILIILTGMIAPHFTASTAKTVPISSGRPSDTVRPNR